MPPFRLEPQTLRFRLVTMLAGLSGVVIVLALVIFTLSSVHRRQADIMSQLRSLARVVAGNSEAAILFNDSKDVTESLASLSARPEILAARMVVHDRTFASFGPSRALAMFATVEGQDIGGDMPLTATRLHLVHRLRDRVTGAPLGRLDLLVDLGAMWREVMRDALVTVGASLLLFAFAILLATRMQRRISAPIEELSLAARRVAETQRYDQRLPPASHDEIGTLVKAFNDMLQEIQTRDGRLAEQRAHLEEQVALRTADLELARDAAVAANRVKSEFLASMSHELRTPLNAVLGFTQLMRDDGRLPQDVHEHLAEVDRAGQHLLALVNDLIDLARIESGRLQLSMEPVKLSDLLGECLEMVTMMARERGVQVELQATRPPGSSGHVLADRTRLRQAVINLLSNAIKYNRQGGRVTLTVARIEGNLRVAVADTGRGIGLDKQHRLFHAFDRLGAETGPVEGTGIGLTITRQIMEAMNGRIGFVSEPGQGSTFWLDLCEAAVPTDEAMEPDPGEADTVSASSSTEHSPLVATGPRPVVLYVEDNVVNLLLIQRVIDKRGDLELRKATSGEQGLAILATEEVDLILLDINLPGMNGYEVLAALQANPGTARIPVVAVTANAMTDEVRRGAAAGFASYLVKPLNLRALNAMFDSYFRAPAPARRSEASHESHDESVS